jgi:hypothetical protein
MIIPIPRLGYYHGDTGQRSELTRLGTGSKKNVGRAESSRPDIVPATRSGLEDSVRPAVSGMCLGSPPSVHGRNAPTYGNVRRWSNGFRGIFRRPGLSFARTVAEARVRLRQGVRPVRDRFSHLGLFPGVHVIGPLDHDGVHPPGPA